MADTFVARKIIPWQSISLKRGNKVDIDTAVLYLALSRIRDLLMVRLNFADSYEEIEALMLKRKSQGTEQTGTECMK